MKKEDLLRAVDSMAIYDKDYEAIMALMSMGDDRFFVKVIEEIVTGNMLFTDLYRLLKDQRYSQALERNLEAQQKLKTEIERTLAFRKELEGNPNYSINPETTAIGVTVQADGSSTEAFYTSQEAQERSAMIYDLLSPDQSDDPVTRQAKLAMYSAFASGSITEEDLLLFARDYIVPISFENQVLNSSDLSFMVENNLTQDQMKKIKALSAFLRRRDGLQ